MLYKLKFGKAEDGIIQQAKALRQPIPKNILDAPELFLGLEIYFIAFCDLHSSRSSGFSVGMIPWDRVRRYAQLMDFSEEQTEDLHVYISAMDEAFREYNEKKIEEERKSKSPKKKGFLGNRGKLGRS